MGKLNRILLILCGIFAIFSFVWPYNRELLIWQATDYANTFNVFYQMFFFVSFIALIILFVAKYIKWIGIVLDYICNRYIIITISIICVLAALVLFILDIPGIWWSWPSFGLQISTVLVIYILLENKVRPHQALLAGVSCSCIAIGLWEIPYQIGRVFIYDKPNIAYHQFLVTLVTEVSIETPLILCGLANIAWINKWNKNTILNKSWLFWIGIIGVFVTYIIWFATGFKVNFIYNWETLWWDTIPNMVWYSMIWRVSKVFMALAMVGLFIKGRKQNAVYKKLPDNPDMDIFISRNDSVSST